MEEDEEEAIGVGGEGVELLVVEEDGEVAGFDGLCEGAVGLELCFDCRVEKEARDGVVDAVIFRNRTEVFTAGGGIIFDRGDT